MNKKKLIRNLLLPPRCLACRKLLPFDGAGGEDIMCRECRGAFEAAKIKMCRTCAAFALDCRCMPDGLEAAGCSSLIKLSEYRASDLHGVINSIVNNSKRYKYHDGFAFLARQLMPGIRRTLDDLDIDECDVLVTYCPRSRRSRRIYGFDQAELLARHITSQSDMTYAKLLLRKHKAFDKKQKKLSFAGRANNVKGAILVLGNNDISGKTILLIDDVVTSGATMAACTAALLDAGAERVVCACIAAAAKENK